MCFLWSGKAPNGIGTAKKPCQISARGGNYNKISVPQSDRRKCRTYALRVRLVKENSAPRKSAASKTPSTSFKMHPCSTSWTHKDETLEAS